MDARYEKLLRCVECVRQKTDFVPQVALVLGSGLGRYAEEIDVVTAVDYGEIEGFPVSTVPGHQGRFVFGYSGDVKVVIMQGRVHYYEGYDISDVVLPARLMAMLGAKVLFLTNASGGINLDFHVGDFMVLTDHIMSFFPNPLIGPNPEQLGTRFPDMSCVYDRDLCRCIFDAAEQLRLEVRQGVYVQLTGPSFESPAEIRMLRTLGADAVGMSTACEAVAGRHAGMRVCGISCVTNLAAGVSPTPLSHQEVFDTAERVAPLFRALVRRSIDNIAKELRV